MMKKMLCRFLPLLLWAALGMISQGQETDPRLFELRTYHAKPGKTAEWLTQLEKGKVPLWEKHGISLIGSWQEDATEDGRVVVLLAYTSSESRDASWDALVEDPEWQKMEPLWSGNSSLLAETESVLLSVTDYSPALSVEAREPSRQFELRTYQTREGRLPDLDARFRDHTMKLFEKHGMTNVVYFHPAVGGEEPDDRLLYFLAHRDDEARQASFAAFRADPVWIQARAASEEQGPILEKDGVSSVLLRPTAFSPLR